MKITKTLFFVVTFSLLSLGSMTSFGQLYDFNGHADDHRSTAYGEDTIFIYHSSNDSKILAANHSNQETSDFLWMHFNKDTKQFDSLFVRANRDFSSVDLDSLYQEGLLKDATEALRVEILSNQGGSEAHNAWVIIDTLDKIVLSEYRNTCDQIKLEVQNLRLPDYRYYDLAALPADTNLITLENGIGSFQWTATEDVSIYWDDTPLYEGDRVVGYIGSPFEMPYDDSDYILELENVFKNEVSDTIENIVAKAVEAGFSIDKLDPAGALVDYDPAVINEALLQVLFENESRNATQYNWTGFNDSLNILRGRKRVLWESDQQVPPEADIPPYKPGRYPVRLSVSNEYGCVDSTTYYHIRVDSSRIDSTLIPNVFTPDGNGLNDVFVLPKAGNLSGNGPRGMVSMKWIEVSVFNRNGQLVYRYDGDPFQWEGWRGKVRNSNRDAAEGVYLYVIKGRGHDGVMHEKKEYSGFLYLFRQ